VYPALEALDGREGAAELRLIVRSDGSVAEARVIEVKGAAAFGDAARAAVLTWTFEPARKDGRAVDCVCTQRLAFKLGRSR
jgi:protein TonB